MAAAAATKGPDASKKTKTELFVRIGNTTKGIEGVERDKSCAQRWRT